MAVGDVAEVRNVLPLRFKDLEPLLLLMWQTPFWEEECNAVILSLNLSTSNFWSQVCSIQLAKLLANTFEMDNAEG